MGFLKKLFGGKGKQDGGNGNEDGINFQGFQAKEDFDTRYVEDNIYNKPELLDGCIKMIEGYFIDNKIERKIADPVNHPLNLDQVIDEGFGFGLYCKAFKLGESEATMFLAYAFSEYLIKTYGFKLFIDKKPETPLRSMTLKYDEQNVVLSLYPFEYSLKALDYESTFVSMDNNISMQIGQLPSVKEIIDRFTSPGQEDQK